MKNGIYGLGIALLVVVGAARPSSLLAQKESRLDKKVTLRADHKRLEEVLEELEKKGLLTFSYKSDILKKDKLVTLTLRESTLREALEQILGREYSLIESDDYVVIRRRADVASQEKVMTSDQLIVDEKIKPKYMKEDKKYMKEDKWNDDVTPQMKMKKRAMMLRRGAHYISDSLNTRDSLNITALRQTVRDIVNDMIADGIVKDKDSFTWFGLDNGQFVVDGRNMADSLRAKYAAKFIKKDGNGYYCGTLSGIQGRGYFFDKEEIYGGWKQ